MGMSPAAYFRALRSESNCTGVRTVAECETQCVDEYRLAGTGLARHHAESACKFELDFVNDRVVFRADQAQHVR